MRYRDTTGTLTVTILEARNLKKMDVAGLSGASKHSNEDMRSVHFRSIC